MKIRLQLLIKELLCKTLFSIFLIDFLIYFLTTFFFNFVISKMFNFLLSHTLAAFSFEAFFTIYEDHLFL